MPDAPLGQKSVAVACAGYKEVYLRTVHVGDRHTSQSPQDHAAGRDAVLREENAREETAETQRVQGSGFRVQGSGFRVQGSGFREYCFPRSPSSPSYTSPSASPRLGGVVLFTCPKKQNRATRKLPGFIFYSARPLRPAAGDGESPAAWPGRPPAAGQSCSAQEPRRRRSCCRCSGSRQSPRQFRDRVIAPVADIGVQIVGCRQAVVAT